MVQTTNDRKRLRVLYSFPHRIGAGRICNTALNQVSGIHQAGCKVLLFTGSVARPLPIGVEVRKTLGIGDLRLPVRLVGRALACKLHDLRVASWIKKHPTEIDLVHCWPLGSLRTLREAKAQGILTFLERPNSHTRFAFDVANEENDLVGINLPENHDHQLNAATLEKEQAEYELADYLLCPSEFVADTFRDEGFGNDKLARHQYGCDTELFKARKREKGAKFRAIYAGVCEPRKGLHYALKAWIASDASENGEFVICGSFVPDYREKLSELLAHPSVKYLGHRSDLPKLMSESHLFLLSSVEEGSALVTYEARASGCLLIVSSSTGAKGVDKKNILLHAPRDWKAMKDHINMAYNDRTLLHQLTVSSLSESDSLSWQYAGTLLNEIYHAKLGSFAAS